MKLRPRIAQARGRRARGRVAVAIAFAALLSVAAAGCGDKVLDQDDAVAYVNRVIKVEHLQPAESVDCPDDVEFKEGTTFECQVTGKNGNTGTFTLRIDDVQGNDATLHLVSAKND